MTLSQEIKFRAKTPFIKKASYNVVMYSPIGAKVSVENIRKMFDKASLDEKKQLILMLQMAGAIAISNSKNAKRYKRKEREKFLEVGNIYKALRRDLENTLKENGSNW
jgi:Holliday junction resolvase RusA-like endonuclease